MALSLRQGLCGLSALGLGFVLGGPALAATATAAPVATAASYGPTTTTNILIVNITIVVQGGTITCSGGGFTPGEIVIIVIHSADPTTLGSTTANSAGDISTSVTIPADIAPGTHTLDATGQTSGHVDSATITVEAATTAAVSTSSSLPVTGADAVAASAVGALAIGAGGALVLAARKRRKNGFVA